MTHRVFSINLIQADSIIDFINNETIQVSINLLLLKLTLVIT